MRKILIYSSLAIISLGVIVMFVTATTYPQLAIAIVTYPLLVYLAFKAFSRPKPLPAILKPVTVSQADAGIADIDRRGFLKLIGAAGASFFLSSIFSKRAEIPFFGRLSETAATGFPNPLANKTGSASTDDYRISEVDDGAITFYGFIKQGGAWFIMQEDTNTGSFRYAKGASGFPDHWANRENLKYDYYHNVF